MKAFFQQWEHLLLSDSPPYVIKPELIDMLQKADLQPWPIKAADALLRNKFHANLIAEPFEKVFGEVTDYPSGREEYIYEIGQKEMIDVICSREAEKQFNQKFHLSSLKFSLSVNQQGIVSGFYVNKVVCKKILGYILLFNGYTLQDNKIRNPSDLDYLDFLLEQGILKLST